MKLNGHSLVRKCPKIAFLTGGNITLLASTSCAAKVLVEGFPPCFSLQETESAIKEKFGVKRSGTYWLLSPSNEEPYYLITPRKIAFNMPLEEKVRNPLGFLEAVRRKLMDIVAAAEERFLLDGTAG